MAETTQQANPIPINTHVRVAEASRIPANQGEYVELVEGRYDAYIATLEGRLKQRDRIIWALHDTCAQQGMTIYHLRRVRHANPRLALCAAVGWCGFVAVLIWGLTQ